MIHKGENRNRNTEVNEAGGVVLGSVTAVTLASENDDRLFFSISNHTNRDVFLQFDLGGVFTNCIFVPRNGYWEMTRNLYSGEIKAITANGSATVTICEY